MISRAEVERKAAEQRYNKLYYAQNRKVIAERRKEKRRDPAYREQVNQSRKAYYAKQKQEFLANGGQPKKCGRQGANIPRMYRLSNGSLIFLHRIGTLCRILNRHHSTISSWVAQGIIPAVEDTQGGVWFTEAVFQCCKDVIETLKGRFQTKRAETEVLRPALRKELEPYHGEETQREA